MTIMEHVFCMPYGKEDINIMRTIFVIMMINANDVADILKIRFSFFFFFSIFGLGK